MVILFFCTPGRRKANRISALFCLLGRAGVLFGVGHESGEARIAMQRFEIGRLFHREIDAGG